MSMLHFLAVATVGVCAIGLTGCAITDKDHTSTTPPSRSGFSGPYAEDFAYHFEHTSSAKVKAVLADGVVSDIEFTEVKANVSACLDEAGMSIDYDEHGGFEVSDNDGKKFDSSGKKINAKVEWCEREFDGGARFLFEQSTRNPNNVDDRPLIVACLLQNKLVPRAYTVQDYDRDEAESSLPFEAFDPLALDCLDDPLGLWASRP